MITTRLPNFICPKPFVHIYYTYVACPVQRQFRNGTKESYLYGTVPWRNKLKDFLVCSIFSRTHPYPRAHQPSSGLLCALSLALTDVV